jgi:hypothetical protein
MKGKSNFTNHEAALIETLIELKLKANASQQKSIRDRIRKLGFYASDFAIGNGYTVVDFQRVSTIDGSQLNTTSKVLPKAVSKVKGAKLDVTKSQTDEMYIIDLCGEILNTTVIRQHRFDFLKGDTGSKLPVDPFYPDLNLVIEYHERQHTEEVKFFDKRRTSSGIGRGEQRKLYDERRKTEIPKHGLELILFSYLDFLHNSSKRLVRDKAEDIKIIHHTLKKYL